MTTFVHCRGCGEKIHESAMTCPKCGAPQGLSAAVSPPPLPSWQSGGAPNASGYGAVPWYRRRWFIILCVLTFPPIAGVLALTGPLYFSYKSQVRMFPKDGKIVLYIGSIASLVQLILPAGGIRSVFYVIAMLVVALSLGFMQRWPEK